MGYGVEGRGSMTGKENIIFFSLQRPDQIMGLPNAHCGIFHGGQSGQSANLTSNSHVVPRSRIQKLQRHSFIRLNDVVFNYLNRVLSVFFYIPLQGEFQ
jgi:hypothetical protein